MTSRALTLLVMVGIGCSHGGDGMAGGTGGTSGAGGSKGGAGGSMSGMGGRGAGGTGMGGTGMGAGGMTGMGGSVGAAGAGGAAVCTPGVQAMLVTDCGYPMASSSPLTTVDFNESDVLRAIEGSGGWPSASIRVFYNDEHALTLGVHQVVVKSASGTMTTDYPISPLTTNPGSATDPKTGTNELVGPQSGLDVSQRPMWPALFITDVTADPNSRAGDWQYGGRPHSPNAIYGTWKGAVRTVDARGAITITPDPDPMKNNWNLGGGDPVPKGLANEGYGAEVVWNVTLTPGHSYRLQAMVHDGDQNKAGGDSGQACVLFCAGGSAPPPSDGGAPPPPPSCPMGTMRCGQDVDMVCPTNTVCANGCCLPVIQ
jgi:hypothetical protein